MVRQQHRRHDVLIEGHAPTPPLPPYSRTSAPAASCCLPSGWLPPPETSAKTPATRAPTTPASPRSAKNRPMFTAGMSASRTKPTATATRLEHSAWSGPLAREAPRMRITCGMAAPANIAAQSCAGYSAPSGSNITPAAPDRSDPHKCPRWTPPRSRSPRARARELSAQSPTWTRKSRSVRRRLSSRSSSPSTTPVRAPPPRTRGRSPHHAGHRFPSCVVRARFLRLSVSHPCSRDVIWSITAEGSSSTIRGVRSGRRRRRGRRAWARGST